MAPQSAPRWQRALRRIVAASAEAARASSATPASPAVKPASAPTSEPAGPTGPGRPPVRTDRMAVHKKAVDAAREQSDQLLAGLEQPEIIPNSVLYESFEGNGMLCNPYAIFTFLLQSPAHQHFTHTWVVADTTENKWIRALYADDERVSFLTLNSAAYQRALLTHQFLINNSTFPTYFVKRPGQTYLNTWHGTPLKRMGFDVDNGALTARNALRNFLAADFLLSCSEYMTEVMYESAYKLRDIYPGTILEVGTPRIDTQFLDDPHTPPAERRAALRAELAAAGLAIDPEKEVIVYAPTWKGKFFSAPVDDGYLLDARLTAILEDLDTDRYSFLIKVHQRAYAVVAQEQKLVAQLLPNGIPTNEILAMADVLVTDYSSIFFDFLTTGRPIVFHVPDLASYEDYRGLYVEQDSWPGPTTRTTEELTRVLNAVGDGTEFDPLRSHAEAYAKAREMYTPWEDGHATERVVSAVIDGRPPARCARPGQDSSKEKILIYLGGMLSNGITTAALNLLSAIDYDRFSVTAFFGQTKDDAFDANIARIHPEVVQIIRVGRIPVTDWEREFVNAYTRAAARTPAERHFARERLGREWYRAFGQATFDYVVDFSGYSGFWTHQLAWSPTGRKSIWLHNDLMAEARNPRRPHGDSLRGVFEMYPDFDRLVSVSATLNQMNRHKLSTGKTRARFTSADNLIDHAKIRRMAYGPPSGLSTALEGAGPLTVTEALERAAQEFGEEALAEEIARRATAALLPPAPPGTTTFVTAGRISPEKNPRRLMRAFRALHSRHPDTRLVIIGTGPEERWVRKVVHNYDLEGYVILTGQLDNPYAVMAQCDCFVMSSDYEGQPMVLLEARVLDLPIVTTGFDSVSGALPEGVGVITPLTNDGLAEGMEQMVTGTVPNPPFDPVAYNTEALAQFYAAIGAPTRRGRRSAPVR